MTETTTQEQSDEQGASPCLGILDELTEAQAEGIERLYDSDKTFDGGPALRLFRNNDSGNIHGRLARSLESDGFVLVHDEDLPDNASEQRTPPKYVVLSDKGIRAAKLLKQDSAES